MQILGWHWGVWALTAVDGQSKIVGILEVKWNANLITRKRWIQKHEIPLLDWFFFSQKALYVIMYSPKNCKGKYKSLFKSWQWRIRPNQSIQPIFMAKWKRQIAKGANDKIFICWHVWFCEGIRGCATSQHQEIQNWWKSQSGSQEQLHKWAFSHTPAFSSVPCS